MRVAASLLAAIGAAAVAQTVAPSAFPDDSTVPTASELKDKLAGNAFDVALAKGVSWRLEYKANGYFFVNTSTGFSDTGEWRTKDGELCYSTRKLKPGCNEARVKAGSIFLKLDNGEVVQYVVR